MNSLHTHAFSDVVKSLFNIVCSSFSSCDSEPALWMLNGSTGLAIFRRLPTRTNCSKPKSRSLGKEDYLDKKNCKMLIGKCYCIMLVYCRNSHNRDASSEGSVDITHYEGSNPFDTDTLWTSRITYVLYTVRPNMVSVKRGTQYHLI